MLKRGFLFGTSSLWSAVVRAPDDANSQQQQQQDQSQQQDKSQQQQQQQDQSQQQDKSQQQQQQDKSQQQDQLPGFLHQASPEVRDALKAHGFKTLDDMGKKLLDLDKNAGAGRVVLPGENATAEELTAFHQAIGVPKDPKDYVLEVDGVKLDDNMGAFARDIFPKAGVTKKGAETIVKGWNKLMADTVKAHGDQQAAQLQAGEEAWAKKNGANHAAHQDLAMRAANELAGLNADEVTALKKAIGVEKAMGLLLGYGSAAASDGPGAAGGHKIFNITSPDQAKAEIDRMKKDPSIGAALRDAGHADHKAVKEKWDRLHDQVAGTNTKRV